MQSLTLLQYTQHIKSLFLGTTAQWISAELAEVSQKSGHYYLDLVQKDEAGRQIVAKTRANLWANTAWMLQTKTQGNLLNLLKVGNKVMLLVAMNFHEVYGFSLVVQNIDVTYTIGELELRRQKTIENLMREGLHEKQKQLAMKPVLQRIAVISSAEAAGFQDFMEHLQNNNYGYKFEVSFFDSRVQGEQAENELIARLEEIGEIADDFDVAVLLRGGGARLDLEVFNSETIARTIAHIIVPILTGIGHTKDQSVADFVSFQSLKTPTALADFIIEHNAIFEQNCETIFQNIMGYTQTTLQIENAQLTELKNRLYQLTQQNLRQQEQTVIRLTDKLYLLAQQKVHNATQQLQYLSKNIDLLNPKNILTRGYTMTLANGKLVTAQTKLSKGDKIKTKGLDFEIDSEVIL
jgi:exodeoxyribonuclease VII large subunit